MSEVFGTYNVFLVFLSYLFIIILVYLALDNFYKLKEKKHTLTWLSMGTLLLGIGFWSMHFIGLLAFEIPLNIHFDEWWLFISFLISLCFSWTMMFLALRLHIKRIYKITIVALVLNLGLLSLHHTGMMAITFDGIMVFKHNPTIWFGFMVNFILAILIMNLILKPGTLTEARKLTLSLVTGIQAATLHFVLMNQMSFLVENNYLDKKKIPDTYQQNFAIDIIVYITGVLLFVLVLSFIQKHFDLKERKDTEQKLLERQKDLIDVVKQQYGMTFKYIKINGDFIFTICDGQLVYKLGLKPSIIIGNKMKHFLPPELADYKTRYFERAWRGEEISYSATFNGVTYYSNLKPVYEEGQVCAVIGSTAEITELIETKEKLEASEQLQRSVLSAMKEGLIVHDLNGIILDANERAASILRIPFDGLIGFNIFSENWHLIDKGKAEIDPDEMPCYITAKTGQAINDQVVGIRHCDTILWISVNSEPLHQNGKFIGVVVTISDITLQFEQEMKLHKSTQELAIAKEEAEKANQSKSLFLSKVSHEIKTPLNSILGYSSIILDQSESLNKENKKQLRKIISAGNHIINLINELSNFNAIEQGKFSLSQGKVNVDETIIDSLRMLKAYIHAYTVTVDYQSPREALCIYADRKRILQILLNLITNAVKYNKAGGVVKIELEEMEEQIKITVRDNGIGIPDKELDKIFEPFYRLKTLPREGTGIGLSVVKQLVHDMAGEYTIESELGKGTIISILFSKCIEISPERNEKNKTYG
jgi:PAS domain S-box-containing protein